MLTRASLFALSVLSARASCPAEPPRPVVDGNATRMFFVGAHHSGTYTYQAIARRLAFAHAQHDRSWGFDTAKLYEGDAFADTPMFWPLSREHEFGHAKHPNVRKLMNCFGGGLFVLNTRSLISWLSSLFHWQFGSERPDCAASERILADKRTKICQWVRAREQYQTAIIDLFAKAPAPWHERFVITDLPREGSANVTRRLCRLRQRFDGRPAGACDAFGDRSSVHVHKSPFRSADARACAEARIRAMLSGAAATRARDEGERIRQLAACKGLNLSAADLERGVLALPESRHSHARVRFVERASGFLSDAAMPQSHEQGVT